MKRLWLEGKGHIVSTFVGGVLVLVVAAGAFYYWQFMLKPALATTVVEDIVTSSTKQATKQAAPKKTDEDLTKLPLGDGKVSTSPKQGYVYSCTSNFRSGGAQNAGDWIVGNTWDETAKPTVPGSVMWQTAYMTFTLNGATREISGNGLPIKLPTGIFPIQANTTAYQYDRNPNSIKSQQVFYDIPANPVAAAAPYCVPMGVIGYMTDGVALFNALDDGGRDAEAHEIQDTCGGHPQMQGVYHYHGMSSCITDEDANATLVGYALDGYGIYSDRDASGKQYTSADLDACHGITSSVMWNGKMTNIYHYVLTHDYPYTIGCFHAKPARTTGA